MSDAAENMVVHLKARVKELEGRLEHALKAVASFERLNLEGRDGHRATYKLIQAWAKGDPGAEEALRAFATPTPPSGHTYLTEPSSAEKLIEAERRLGACFQAVADFRAHRTEAYEAIDLVEAHAKGFAVERRGTFEEIVGDPAKKTGLFEPIAGEQNAAAVNALADLCALKLYKRVHGKDAYYLEQAPEVWKRAMAAAGVSECGLEFPSGGSTVKCTLPYGHEERHGLAPESE